MAGASEGPQAAGGRRAGPAAASAGRDQFETALTGCPAGAALDPQVTRPRRRAARRGVAVEAQQAHAAGSEKLRETRGDGWFRAAPGHPWLAPQVTGDPGHVPSQPGSAVDGKERNGAKTAVSGVNIAG